MNPNDPANREDDPDDCPSTVPPDPDETEIASAAPRLPRPGAGRDPLEVYEIVKRLGAGGMGIVDLAVHRDLGFPRALKRIRDELAQHPKARARLRRETKLQARLHHHPGVVRVFDASLNGDGPLFLVMEYVAGLSLDRHLKGQPMPMPWIVRFLTTLCEVVQFAHQHGIMHGDLKPSNLLFEDAIHNPEGLKVSDWGLARMFMRMDPSAKGSITETGDFSGSPPYSSPEQIEGLRTNARSDVYSIGVILFELLTGCRPYTGNRARIIADTLSNKAVPSFRSVNPKISIPTEIEQVVRHCLEKDPLSRYGNSKMVLGAFLKAVEGTTPRKAVGASGGLLEKVRRYLPGPF
jgi:serine/threonine-protein kinase